MKRTIIVLLTIAAAFAQDKAVDFTLPILGLDKKPLLQPNSDPKATPVPITLGDIAAGALYATIAEDKTVSDTEKGAQTDKFYKLAQKLYGNKKCVLTIEDRALLLHRIPLAYGVIYAGPARQMLDATLKEEK